MGSKDEDAKNKKINGAKGKAPNKLEDLEEEDGAAGCKDTKLRHGQVLEINNRKCMVLSLDSEEQYVPLKGAKCGTCSAVIASLDENSLRDETDKYFMDGHLVCEKCRTFFEPADFTPKYFVCISPLCRRKWKQLTSKVMPLFCPACKKQLEECVRQRSRYTEVNALEQMYMIWMEVFQELSTVLGYPAPKGCTPKALQLLGKHVSSGNSPRPQGTTTSKSTTATVPSPSTSLSPRSTPLPPPTPGTASAKARMEWREVLQSFEESFPTPPKVEDTRNWNSVRSRRKHYRGVVRKKLNFLIYIEATEEYVGDEVDVPRKLSAGSTSQRVYPYLNLDNSLYEGNEVCFIAFPNPAVGERTLVSRVVKLLDAPEPDRRSSSPQAGNLELRPVSSPAISSGVAATPPHGFHIGSTPPGLDIATPLMTPQSGLMCSPPGLEHLAPCPPFDKAQAQGGLLQRNLRRPPPRLGSKEEIEAELRQRWQETSPEALSLSMMPTPSSYGGRTPKVLGDDIKGGETPAGFGDSNMFGDLIEWSNDPVSETHGEPGGCEEGEFDEAAKNEVSDKVAPLRSSVALSSPKVDDESSSAQGRQIRFEVALNLDGQTQKGSSGVTTKEGNQGSSGSISLTQMPLFHPDDKKSPSGASPGVPAQPKRMPPGLRRTAPPNLRSPSGSGGYGKGSPGPKGAPSKSPGMPLQSPYAAYFGD